MKITFLHKLTVKSGKSVSGNARELAAAVASLNSELKSEQKSETALQKETVDWHHQILQGAPTHAQHSLADIPQVLKERKAWRRLHGSF